MTAATWAPAACLALAVGGVWLAIRCARYRTHHRIPAAPDNQAGRDTDSLWTCRRIGALPTTNPRKEKPQP